MKISHAIDSDDIYEVYSNNFGQVFKRYTNETGTISVYMLQYVHSFTQWVEWIKKDVGEIYILDGINET